MVPTPYFTEQIRFGCKREGSMALYGFVIQECMRKHKKWCFFHDSPLVVVNFWRVVSRFYGSKSILLLWVVRKLTTRHSTIQYGDICGIHHASGEWWVVKKAFAHTLYFMVKWKTTTSRFFDDLLSGYCLWQEVLTNSYRACGSSRTCLNGVGTLHIGLRRLRCGWTIGVNSRQIIRLERRITSYLECILL